MKKRITLRDKLRMYWYGLKLKPRRMMGNSGKCTWVVASSHSLYSTTWTWAIYWTKPKCWRFKVLDFKKGKECFTLRSLFCLGFHISTQRAILREEMKEIW